MIQEWPLCLSWIKYLRLSRFRMKKIARTSCWWEANLTPREFSMRKNKKILSLKLKICSMRESLHLNLREAPKSYQRLQQGRLRRLTCVEGQDLSVLEARSYPSLNSALKRVIQWCKRLSLDWTRTAWLVQPLKIMKLQWRPLRWLVSITSHQL